MEELAFWRVETCPVGWGCSGASVGRQEDFQLRSLSRSRKVWRMKHLSG